METFGYPPVFPSLEEQEASRALDEANKAKDTEIVIKDKAKGKKVCQFRCSSQDSFNIYIY